ncbi:hypothetical protein [Streptomyces sp. NPDC002994]|uniref:hypothetical protein n=1 Tax=Streptomyces sp. NPDC002994 TaxID=3154441 RepID=UPI0033AC96F1
MAVLIVLGTVFVAGIEQFVQWKYGLPGAVALSLLGVGFKACSTNCTTLGAVIFVLLMLQA